MSPAPVRIGLLGASGRMGQIVQRVVSADYSARAAITFAPGRKDIGSLPEGVEAVVDFSLPEAVLAFSRAVGKLESPPALVVASTGWEPEARKELDRYAAKAPVMVASNYSFGVHALHEILRTASPLLRKLGYTPVIVEAHHRHKRDAPSGTALALQKTVAPESPSSIQTHAVRAGEVIGDHEVTFYGAADKITIGHFAQDRSIFARGAVEAALWLASRRAHGARGYVPIEEFFRA